MQVNKDGSGYPPNSVIVGMFEGYYSHPGVGGVRATLSVYDWLGRWKREFPL